MNSASTTIWNGGIGVAVSRRLRLSVDGFNLLDSKASDIEYFYTSRLPGEPPGGVDDIHTHPSLPRMARMTLRVTF